MRIIETTLPGARLIELEPCRDERGLFARTFCSREFQNAGLPATFVQCNISFNRSGGTVRGLHYQTAPSQESKLVRCVAGAIWDVIVDLREDSATYLHHFAVELSAVNRLSLFVPPQFAHGFQTLRDDTEVFYQMGDFYAPELSCGLRYDDPLLGIVWPLPVSAISARDQQWPLLTNPSRL